MDDDLGQPNVLPENPSAEKRESEDEEQSSGDEDEGPDWTKLPTVARPIIPKRGEKDFEPKISGGSGLQRHALDRARSAMLEALKTTRTSSNKSVSSAVWYPEFAHAHVTVARGIHFSTMGHSVARTPPSYTGDRHRIPKRLELLPEEALYLVERGAMFCWSAKEPVPLDAPGLEGMEGVPMTVQQAFAEMIGKEELTLEKYQVYAYLRRLGYVVTRAKPPSDAYPLAAPFDMKSPAVKSLFARCFAHLASFLHPFLALFRRKFDWWMPVQFGRWLHHDLGYPGLYRSLRFLSSGYDKPLHVKRPSTPSPYQIFYNLYKPSTPFKKTAPPAPDFSVVVINARTTPMPTIVELNDLFGVLPELPPPAPRKRGIAASRPQPPPKPAPAPTEQRTLLQRVLPWVYPSSQQPTVMPRKPNPFAVLKAGNKMVVIAAVDAGTISFFRFGQGAFEDFPMN